ncbi:MAG: LysO family transporter [Alistipes sp.]
MFQIFAVILGGIVLGRLLSRYKLSFIPRLITVIVWVLLFLLGAEVGSNPEVVRGMLTLGRSAFVIFVCAVAGSILMSWLLWLYIKSKTAQQ